MMPRRRLTRPWVGVMLSLAAACALPRTQANEPVVTAASQLNATLAQAEQETRVGRYGVADKLLSDFAARYPSSQEGADALFWRALLKLDPANGVSSLHESIALLDTFASTPYAATRRLEVVTLKRTAETLLAHAAAIVPSGPTASAPVSVPALARPEDKVRDEEIVRLKDELARANGELERIRRRLAQPKP